MAAQGKGVLASRRDPDREGDVEGGTCDPVHELHSHRGVEYTSCLSGRGHGGLGEGMGKHAGGGGGWSVVVEGNVGTSERRDRERNQRRERILEAAFHLFRRDGFLKVKMADVARECELSTGALYLYFKSKEDIFAALALLGSQRMDAVLLRTFSLGGPMTPERLAGLFRELLEIYEDYGVYFDALKHQFLGNRALAISDAHAGGLREQQLAVFERVAAFLEEQRSFGVVAPTWNLDHLCFILWAQLLGMAQVLGEGRNRLLAGRDLDEFLLDYARFVLRGVAAGSLA